MKNVKRRLTLPVLAVALAAGGALLTSAKDVAIKNGHQFDPTQNQCVDMSVECTDVANDEFCTTLEGQPLYDLQGTSCPERLYRIQD